MRDFLQGKETKTTTVFKLQDYEAYGIYSSVNERFIAKFIGVLVDYDIFEKVKDDKKHENYHLKEDNPSNAAIAEMYKTLNK